MYKFIYKYYKPLKMFFRIFSSAIILVICLTQISIFLTNPRAFCISSNPSSFPSSPSPQAHQCCCTESESCCCDVRQEPPRAWPDMVLPKISGSEYSPAPQLGVSENDLPSSPLSQYPKLTVRWTGTGPPFTSTYLVNLTLRC